MDKKDNNKNSISVGYYHTLDDKQITIPLEEYKELLIIKGKYEELKSQYQPYRSTITYTGGDNTNSKYPYTVTC